MKKQLEKEIKDWNFVVYSLLKVSLGWLAIPAVLRLLSGRTGLSLFRETELNSPETIISVVMMGVIVIIYIKLWRLKKQYERSMDLENK